MLKLDVRETMQAQSYAAYMMAASCFGSSVCTTPQMLCWTERSCTIWTGNSFLLR